MGWWPQGRPKLHDWSDWVVTERGELRDDVWRDRLGSYLIQERYCRACGKTDLDERTSVKVSRSTIRLRINEPRKPKHDKVHP